jgi:hypothetical protein
MGTQTEGRSSSRLRVAGFLTTVGGAAVLGVGCVLLWVSVHLAGDDSGVLDQTYLGIDLWQGKVAIGCAVILLIGVLILRIRRSAGGGKTLAGLMIAAGLIAFAVSAEAAFTQPADLETDSVDAMVGSAAAALGLPANQARSQVEALVDLGVSSSAEFGVFVTMAGAILASIGAVLGLAWTSARPEDPAHAEAPGPRPGPADLSDPAG